MYLIALQQVCNLLREPISQFVLLTVEFQPMKVIVLNKMRQFRVNPNSQVVYDSIFSAKIINHQQLSPSKSWLNIYALDSGHDSRQRQNWGWLYSLLALIKKGGSVGWLTSFIEISNCIASAKCQLGFTIIVLCLWNCAGSFFVIKMDSMQLKRSVNWRSLQVLHIYEVICFLGVLRARVNEHADLQSLSLIRGYYYNYAVRIQEP